MNKKTPIKVSVLITVFNGEKYLKEALKSMASQTFESFELIIIDDGSTDSSPDIIERFINNNQKLIGKTIRQENKGRAQALNKAINFSEGEYIAIMDCDDVSLPNRLAKQTNFLDQNPEVGLLGSAYILSDLINKHEEEISPETSDARLRRLLPIINPFIHSSVMFRREVFDKIGLYNEDLPCSIDYELYIRTAKYFKMANLNQILIIHRFHQEQHFLSGLNPRIRMKTAASNKFKAVRELDLPAFYYIYPIMYSIYASLPFRLKPNRLKKIFKVNTDKYMDY